jgi:hypothetical protein
LTYIGNHDRLVSHGERTGRGPIRGLKEGIHNENV